MIVKPIAGSFAITGRVRRIHEKHNVGSILESLYDV
jgi:hypothetical protein